jgi:hypothetical protein
MSSRPAKRRRRVRKLASKPSDCDCHFDKLPDDLVTRILYLSVLEKDKPPCSDVGSNCWLGARDWPGEELPPPAAKLCRLERVCSRFRRLVTQVESIAWEFDYRWGLKEKKVVDFSKRTELLRGLKIHRCYTMGPIPADVLKTVLQASPRLVALELYFNAVDEDSDTESEADREPQARFTSQQLVDALANCPLLTTVCLRIESLELVTPFKIKQPYSNLKHLTLNTRGTIVDDGEISGAAVAYLIRFCPVLQTLILVGEPSKPERLCIISSSLEVLILEQFSVSRLKLETPNLLKLLLGWSPDKTVIHAPQLKSFKCKGATFMSPDFHLAVPWKVQDLTLDEDIEQEELIAGLNLCPNLRRLDLGKLEFSDGYFDLTVLRALAGLKSLEELVFDGRLGLLDEEYEGGDFELRLENIVSIHLEKLEVLKFRLATVDDLPLCGLLMSRAPKLREVCLDARALNKGCSCGTGGGLCRGLEAEIFDFRCKIAVLNSDVKVVIDHRCSDPAESDFSSDEDQGGSEEDDEESEDELSGSDSESESAWGSDEEEYVEGDDGDVESGDISGQLEENLSDWDEGLEGWET